MQYVGTVDVPIDDLARFPGNARVHDAEALDESVRVNGQYRSVVARRRDDRYELLAGHGTVDAFRRHGDSTVRVEVIEADDTEARRIVLADNGTSRHASYDDRLLLDLIDAAARDGGLTGTGWDTAAYEELLSELGCEKPFDFDEDSGADLEPPAEAVTQTGDVWELGDHRLVCGDSAKPEAWASLLGTESGQVRCVWTDPPYGVSYVGKTPDALTVENDDLDEHGLSELIAGVFDRAEAECVAGAAWYVATPAGPLNLLFGADLHRRGIYRQTLIWVKDQFVLGRSDYHYRHEPILYGWKPGAAHHAVEDRTQDTVWEFPRPVRSAEHPTMKPVALVLRALVNSTLPGALVVDPFGGSGTTLIASHASGRRARLIEISPQYCDVIARRYQQVTSEHPRLRRTGETWDFEAEPPGPTLSDRPAGT